MQTSIGHSTEVFLSKTYMQMISRVTDAEFGTFGKLPRNVTFCWYIKKWTSN